MKLRTVFATLLLLIIMLSVLAPSAFAIEGLVEVKVSEEISISPNLVDVHRLFLDNDGRFLNKDGQNHIKVYINRR